MTPRPEIALLAPDSPVSAEPQYESNFTYEKWGLSTMPGYGSNRGDVGGVEEHDLHKSLKQLHKDCSDMTASIKGNDANTLTLTACQGSLQNDMSAMLDEANVLVENIGEHLITPWRASLAQARVDSYLETIKSAIESRDQFDDKLAQLTSAIAPQVEEGQKSVGLPVQISSWRTPSLCFDLEVGQPAEYASTEKMPIKVRVRAIAEVQAKDIDAGNVPHYSACRVQVEECKHEERTMFSMAGTVGEALIKIRISPLENAKKTDATWGEDADVGLIRVQEARIVQRNAFPPVAKRGADLYVSSLHGSSEACVMLKIKTQRVLDGDEAPEVDIELVMAPY